MRWLFLLLLLANAVFFVWQNRLVSETKVAEVLPNDVVRVRLLREIDASLLLPRGSDNTPAEARSISESSVMDGSTEDLSLEKQSPEPGSLENDALESSSLESLSAETSPREVRAKDELVAPQDSELNTLANERSVTNAPVTDKPVTDKPVTDKPVTDKPVMDQWCQVVSGLGSKDEAQQLLEGLEKAGLSAVIKVYETEAVLAFELIMDKPAAADENAALMDNYFRLDIQPQELRLNGVAVYVLGRFGSRSEVDEALSRLKGLSVPRIYQRVSKDSNFEVWVGADEARETSNEINQLASVFPYRIKIEKKTCKGVASTEGRD